MISNKLAVPPEKMITVGGYGCLKALEYLGITEAKHFVSMSSWTRSNTMMWIDREAMIRKWGLKHGYTGEGDYVPSGIVSQYVASELINRFSKEQVMLQCYVNEIKTSVCGNFEVNYYDIRKGRFNSYITENVFLGDSLGSPQRLVVEFDELSSIKRKPDTNLYSYDYESVLNNQDTLNEIILTGEVAIVGAGPTSLWLVRQLAKQAEKLKHQVNLKLCLNQFDMDKWQGGISNGQWSKQEVSDYDKLLLLQAPRAMPAEIDYLLRSNYLTYEFANHLKYKFLNCNLVGVGSQAGLKSADEHWIPVTPSTQDVSVIECIGQRSRRSNICSALISKMERVEYERMLLGWAYKSAAGGYIFTLPDSDDTGNFLVNIGKKNNLPPYSIQNIDEAMKTIKNSKVF